MKLPFNYTEGLYRKNNHGQPCVWFAQKLNHNQYTVFHGILGKTITSNVITTHREAILEIQSKIKSKQKEGYKYLYELKDNTTMPVEGELISYLNTYLLDYRTTVDGSVLPMLAKTFDNQNKFH